ncbi:MAG: UDP-N-acetylmuramoyl-tripeptide--D-alanyl-D-alanine ligase, partial [Bacteroidota bacterium]
KTTTKELIASVLSKKYNVWFTRGNFNNHIGVPLTLLSIPPLADIVVVEMGANHIGEIAQLCEIALPNHGLITNIGHAHIEGFGSIEGVMKGKGELYDFLKKNGGEIFINVDNERLMNMVGGYYPWIGYGTGEGAVVKGSHVSAKPFLKFQLTTSRVDELPVETQLLGAYNLENALAAASVGYYFGIEETMIKEAISDYQPANNRSQFYDTGKNKVLLDAYNANPSSMKVALEHFKNTPHPRKILILGSMKELGEESLQEHQCLIRRVLELEFSSCFLTGPEFEPLVPDDHRFVWCRETQELKKALKLVCISDALILVKGSRANKLEEVIDVL